MTTPAFPVHPGDKLRVTKHHPYGTVLVVGDLVTVTTVGVTVERGHRLAIVSVSTAHGPQILGLDVVEPYELPSYAPADPDEIVDAQLRALAASDPELGSWASDADTALGAVEPALSPQLGGTTTEAPVRRTVGETYDWEDADGDELSITYFEQECPDHGREGGFLIQINDEDAVSLPAPDVDDLIRYLFRMKKHSERDDD